METIFCLILAGTSLIISIVCLVLYTILCDRMDNHLMNNIHLPYSSSKDATFGKISGVLTNCEIPPQK